MSCQFTLKLASKSPGGVTRPQPSPHGQTTVELHRAKMGLHRKEGGGQHLTRRRE